MITEPSEAAYPGMESDLARYVCCSQWVSIIMSQCVLAKLGASVTSTYCQALWSTARTLNDAALMEITFKHHMHTIARNRQLLRIMYHVYDPDDEDQSHTYEMTVVGSMPLLANPCVRRRMRVILDQAQASKPWSRLGIPSVGC